MRIFFPIAICLLFSSCATILNKSHYDILFSSDKPNTKVTILDSSYTLPAKVNVKRQKAVIPFTVKTDSLSKDFALHPYTDGKMALNATQAGFMPVGFAIDWMSKQRFTYGKFVNISTHGDSICVYGSNPRAFGQRPPKKSRKNYAALFGMQKGEIYITPGVSQFSVVKFQNRYGFVNDHSLATALLNLDYVYRDNHYISVGAGYTAPFSDLIGDNNYRTSAFFANVSDNYVWKSVHFSYGLGFMRAHTSILDENYDGNEYGNRYYGEIHDKSLLAKFGVSYRFHKQIYFTANYQPSFYRLSPNPEWNYQHLLNFGFTFKFRVRKMKQ